MENNMEKENKPSLGYVYGYKESESNGNQITVKFIHGTSFKYPKKLEKKKDFYAEEIFEGDSFELYYNKEEFINIFSKEIKQILNNKDYYSDLYEQRKEHYFVQPTKEQYFALTAFDYAILNFIGKNFESENQKSELLQHTVGQFYGEKNLAVLESLHDEHRNVSEYVYEQELSLFFNEIPKKKNIKP